jgi:hypothetical protein
MAPIHSPIIQFRRSRLVKRKWLWRYMDGDSKIRVTYFCRCFPSGVFCRIPPPIVKIHCVISQSPGWQTALWKSFYSYFCIQLTARHRKSNANSTGAYFTAPGGTKLTKNEAKYANVCNPLGTQQVRANTFQSNFT